MKQKFPIPLSAASALRKLGEDIRDARRRRRITMALLAERAGINVITLAKIEKGHTGTSMGAYASALNGLGMLGRLRDVADGIHDLTGQMLADERLPKRVRIRRNRDDDEPAVKHPKGSRSVPEDNSQGSNNDNNQRSNQGGNRQGGNKNNNRQGNNNR